MTSAMIGGQSVTQFYVENIALAKCENFSIFIYPIARKEREKARKNSDLLRRLNGQA
jgi:hypothetical protein